MFWKKKLLDLVYGITLWTMSCEDVQMWNYLRKQLRHYCLSPFINVNIVLTIVIYMYVYFILLYCIPCHGTFYCPL